MDNNELKTTLEELEQEVLDELNNPYHPYSVIFPYEGKLTIPDDDPNTEITIRTRSEEVRFGRNENDILLRKDADKRYGRDTYSKHILDWVSKRLPDFDPREFDLEIASYSHKWPLRC